MFFVKNSPLRNVPVAVDVRSTLFLDGLRYSVEICDLVSSRLQDSLDVLAADDDSAKTQDDSMPTLIVSAISDAWILVDSIHRARELTQQLPGLKHSLPEVQLFLRGTATIEELRHFVQHMRTGIGTFVNARAPLWGTLSWSRINPDTGAPESHTIVPGTVYDKVQAFTCTFDREEGRFIQRLVLMAGGRVIELAEAVDRTRRFGRWLESWAENEHGRGDHHGSDAKYSFTVTLIKRS